MESKMKRTQATRRGGSFLLFLVALLATFSVSMAIDAGELQALQVLMTQYPDFKLHWSDVTLDECVSSPYSTVPMLSCGPGGHITTLHLGTYYDTGPTNALGNISGLAHVHTLYLHMVVPDYDAWFVQLPALSDVIIENRGTTPLSSSFKGNFSMNPLLKTLAISDQVRGPPLTSKLPRLPLLETIRLNTSEGNMFGTDFLVNNDAVRDLSITVTGVGGHPHFTYTHLPIKKLQILDPGMTSLPADFGNLATLVDLEISAPKLQRLPASTSSLTSLTKFRCVGCKLNLADSIPSLQNTALTSLDLAENKMTQVPEGLCFVPNTTSSFALSLAKNPLTSLPSCWNGNTAFVALSFSEAQFTEFPSVLTSMTGLEALSIYDTPSLGQAGVVIPDLSVLDLGYLQLTDCGFVGPFPASLKTRYNLNYLFLSGNQFNDTMPSDFFYDMVHLWALDLSQSNLSGTFPSPQHRDYGGIHFTLRVLRIGDNKFTGLHPEFINCSSLQGADLSNNDFVDWPFELADMVSQMPSLTSLNIAFTTFLTAPPRASTLPTFFTTPDSRLERFNASGCGFIGTLTEISGYRLKALDLSRNQISGSFNVDFPNLYELYISHNQLSGPIPQSALQKIEYLDISYNQFTGLILLQFGDITELRADGNSIQLCPPTWSSIPSFHFQVCSLQGESQRITSCPCANFYFRIGCSITTSCVPPPPPPSSSPGPSPNPYPNPSPVQGAPSSPSSIVTPHGAVSMLFIFSALSLFW